MKRHLSTLAIAVIGGALSFATLQYLQLAIADQSERVPPTTGIYTGPQYAQKIGDLARSVSTANKGPTAPANVGGTTVDGLEWIDDSVTPWLKKRYVSGNWAIEGALNPTDSSYVGVVGGGIASLSSASTVDLGSVPQANVLVTGTVTITGFGSAAPTGIVKFLTFDDALTLTYSSSLKVPGGFNLVTAADDSATVKHLGSGNWIITQYTRANGIPIDVAAVGKPDFSFQASVPALHVLGDGRALTRTVYPAYTAKMSRAQNGTRSSGNATISSVANTSGFGIGMPVEGTGINSGCTITSIVDNTSITLNSSSCVTTSGISTLTVFLTGYGTGGTSSTIGVPDCIGRKFAGRDVPGARKNRLTATYFGSDSTVMAVSNGREDRNLSISNIDSFTPAINGGSVKINGLANLTYNTISPPVTGGLNFSFYGLSGPSGTVAITHDLTIGALGSGTAHAIIDPTVIADCVVRVTP